MLCLPAITGCAQMAVVGRIFYGDPKLEGFFEQLTGESLEDGGGGKELAESWSKLPACFSVVPHRAEQTGSLQSGI